MKVRTTDVFDRNGHGTKMAGLVAAKHCKPNSSRGITGCLGVARWSSIRNFRIADKHGRVEPDALICAAERLSKPPQRESRRKIRVVLLALDDLVWNDFQLAEIENIFQTLKKANLLVIVAAGDHAMDLGDKKNSARFQNHPACQKLDNLLVVSALDRYNSLYTRSNFSRSLVHLAAPGTELLTVCPAGPALVNGSSGAAAIVAGVACLLFGHERYEEASAAQVAEIIRDRCTRRVDALSEKIKDGRALDLSSFLEEQA